MIHYHGTPSGGKGPDSARFLSGRHALVSFAFPQDISVVAEVCQSFCLDNGAFSFWKSGTEVDWDQYADWVRKWHAHPGYDFALIPDIINGDEEENVKLIRKYQYSFRSAVPVYHLHESVDHAGWLATHFPNVAIGSSGQWPSPGTDNWWNRMEEVMGAMCDPYGKPKCKLHGLRMLDPEIFSRLPLSSADSTNAAVNGGSLKRYGQYVPPTRWQRSEVIAERIESVNSSPIWVKDRQTTMKYELSLSCAAIAKAESRP